MCKRERGGNIFQSTPSQRGRRAPRRDPARKRAISIHALAKRATVAPKGNATQRKAFQSTPSQRGRLHIGVTSAILYGISIHALAKRATLLHEPRLPRSSYFNPRPRKEGDLQNHNCIIPVQYFNPRPRKEGDAGWDGADTVNPSISIHALVKRATSRTPTRQGIKYDFNPRPRKEGDRKNLANMACLAYFNPRPRKEGDQKKTDKR